MASSMVRETERRRLSKLKDETKAAGEWSREDSGLLGPEMIARETLEIDDGSGEEEDHHDHFFDFATNAHALYLFCFVFFFCGCTYTMYFGMHVMNWSVLQSVFFFAITVSTTGYSDFNADSDREYKWLLAYMWVCVLVCGIGLGVMIALAHESFETSIAESIQRTYAASLGGGGVDKDGVGNEDRGKHASRIVAHARAKLRNLNHRLVMEFAQLAVLYVFGVFMIRVCEPGWDLLEAAIWATESLTTIGYGDIIPESNAGMAFTIVYLIVGAAMFARIVAFISMYPATANELNGLVETMESVGMRRRKRGPLHVLGKGAAAGCEDCSGAERPQSRDYNPRAHFAGAPAEPGKIEADVLAEIWSIRNTSLRQIQETESSQRLALKSIKDKGSVPTDLDAGASEKRLDRHEFILHFLTMIKKIDPNDILDASDFYNSLCEHNPNAFEHGLTLDEARHATDRFNRLAIYESAIRDADAIPEEYEAPAPVFPDGPDGVAPAPYQADAGGDDNNL